MPKQWPPKPHCPKSPSGLLLNGSLNHCLKGHVLDYQYRCREREDAPTDLNDKFENEFRWLLIVLVIIGVILLIMNFVVFRRTAPRRVKKDGP